MPSRPEVWWLPERPTLDLREIPTASFARHPWERARVRFFLSGLAKAGLLGEPRTVMDVGSGDAFFAGELADRLAPGSRVVCCDSNYTDRQLAELPRTLARPALSFVRQVPDERFDLIVLLDVLEHVADDGALLGGLVERNLKAGGHALVSVPAWMSLFTRHDLGVAHHRRYRPGQLVGVVKGAGLEVKASGGLFHSLLFPRALQKLGERARGIRSVPAPESAPDEAASDIATWRHGSGFTRAVDWALGADNALSVACARLRLPLPGLSAWALAQRPAPA